MADKAASHFEWPAELLDSQRFDVARNIIPLLVEFREWVNRRVDTIEFFHETRVHHHVSVDFTIPGFSLPTLVTPHKQFLLLPLTLLRKQPLKNFDLRDEDGRALPILSSEENGKIASAVLTYLAEYILSKEKPPQKLDDSVKTELTDIAIRSAAESAGALRNLQKPQGAGSHQQRTTLWDDDDMRVLSTDFARNFILLTALEGQPGDRRIIKFSYEETIRPMRLSLLRWAGLQAVPYGARIASLGTARSYHVEIGIPDDLVFETASLYAAGSSTPLPGSQKSVARAHLYAQGMSRATPGIVETHLRVRSPIVLETLLASAITSAVLGGGILLHWLQFHPSPDVLTVLVVILPAIFAAFLVRPGVHPVVLRLVTGLRAGILLSALLSFVAAGSLAVSFSGPVRLSFGPIGPLAISFSAPVRLVVWVSLFAISFLVTVISVIAYIQAILTERHT